MTQNHLFLPQKPADHLDQRPPPRPSDVFVASELDGTQERQEESRLGSDDASEEPVNQPGYQEHPLKRWKNKGVFTSKKPGFLGTIRFLMVKRVLLVGGERMASVWFLWWICSHVFGLGE